MASQKKQRKLAKLARQGPAQSGSFRHPDGDRRRRTDGPNVKEAIARKRAMREPPPLPE